MSVTGTGGGNGLDNHGVLLSNQGRIYSSDTAPVSVTGTGSSFGGVGIYMIGEGTILEKRYDRVVLVSVLGEIPDQTSALEEIYQSIAPGGILSISETIFDPHFQSRKKVTQLASQMGFKEKCFFGKRYAYTIHLEKPL